MIAIGIGCRRGVSATQIQAAVAAARAALPELAGPAILCSGVPKAAEAGLREAGAALAMPLRFFAVEALRDVPTVTRSKASLAEFGVASMAEAAALIGAGKGARLLLPRIIHDGVTCAIAQGEDQ